MHVLTHSVIAEVVYRSAPVDLQSFLRLSDLELHYFSHLPDEVDNDNILVTGGCALEEAWGHSYKLLWDRQKDEVTPVGGSAVEVITQVPRLARNAVKEGRFDEAREHLARSMHVATDLGTIWHLTRELTADQHAEGERDIAKFARKLLKPPIDPLPLANPKSLYWSVRDYAEVTLRSQLNQVKTAQDNGSFATSKDLIAEMLARCAAGSLTVLLYAWRVCKTAWK